jgi:hypothetical protein
LRARRYAELLVLFLLYAVGLGVIIWWFRG